MQKILYIRIRIFLPPKLKILIYAYKKKKVWSPPYIQARILRYCLFDDNDSFGEVAMS